MKSALKAWLLCCTESIGVCVLVRKMGGRDGSYVQIPTVRICRDTGSMAVIRLFITYNVKIYYWIIGIFVPCPRNCFPFRLNDENKTWKSICLSCVYPLSTTLLGCLSVLFILSVSVSHSPNDISLLSNNSHIVCINSLPTEWQW